MSSVNPGSPRSMLVVGVPPGDIRRWFPDSKGITIWPLDDDLPSRLRAGLPGSTGHLLLCSELSDGQVAALRRKAQERRVHYYGPTDPADLGRTAHRLVGLKPPACRTEEQERDQLNQMVIESWAKAEELEKKLAALNPEETIRIRTDLDVAKKRIVSLEGDLRGLRNELQRRTEEVGGLTASLSDVRGKEASATARADELHQQLEEARAAVGRSRDEQEKLSSELGRAREELAGMKARLDQTLAEIKKIRDTAEAKVKSAEDRSSEEWQSAVLAQHREPALKAALVKCEADLLALRARAKADEKIVRELKKEVAAGHDARQRLAQLGKMIGGGVPRRSRKGSKK